MLAEPSLEAVLAALESERPAACVIDSVQTLAVPDAAPGSVGAVREATSALLEAGQATRRHADPDRPRDQGGLARGAAGARAPGRLRTALRGRAGADLPHAACAEEPLRRHQRGRRLRDAPGRAGRGRRSLGPLRRRGAARAGLGGALRDGGDPSAAGRGAGAGRSDRDRAPAPHRDRRRSQPVGAGARGADPPRRALAFIGRRLRQRRRRRPRGRAGRRPGGGAGIASAHSGRALETDGKPLACFGEVGLTGEVRYVAHADRRVAEARKFGLDRILGPPPGEQPIAGLSAVGGSEGRAAVWRGWRRGGPRPRTTPCPQDGGHPRRQDPPARAA